MLQSYRDFEEAHHYTFGCPDGAWAARLDYKAWGKRSNMILYFTETMTGVKRWLSVFGNNGYRPRDGNFDFGNDGHPGEFFTLTSTHDPKTGNPIFQAAQLIQPTRTRAKFRSQGFMIAENFDCCICPECKECTDAFSIALPPGFERLKVEGSDHAGQWERIDCEAMLNGVTFLSEKAVTAMRIHAQHDYRVDISGDNHYWLNHCENCGVLLHDEQHHDEPGGAFFPITEYEAAKVILNYYDEPIEIDAHCADHGILFIDYMDLRKYQLKGF